MNQTPCVFWVTVLLLFCPFSHLSISAIFVFRGRFRRPPADIPCCVLIRLTLNESKESTCPWIRLTGAKVLFSVQHKLYSRISFDTAVDNSRYWIQTTELSRIIVSYVIVSRSEGFMTASRTPLYFNTVSEIFMMLRFIPRRYGCQSWSWKRTRRLITLGRSAFPAGVQVSYVGIIQSDLIVIPESFPETGKSVAHKDEWKP